METIAFTKVKLPFGWLGNMSAFPVVHNGSLFKTTEALFQAMRFDWSKPDGIAIAQHIRIQKSPMAAKLAAKTNAVSMIVVPRSPTDVCNMCTCLTLKLEQHTELIGKLRDTENALIIEDVSNRQPSESNDFWGARLVNGEWVGQNMLGKLWMDLRGCIKLMSRK